MKKLKNTSSAQLCSVCIIVVYINNDRQCVAKSSYSRAGHFRYFLSFSIINSFFAFFFKLIWLGVGFLNTTGAEIGCKLDKKCNKIIFYYGKIKKYLKCPALSCSLGNRKSTLGRNHFFGREIFKIAFASCNFLQIYVESLKVKNQKRPGIFTGRTPFSLSSAVSWFTNSHTQTHTQKHTHTYTHPDTHIHTHRLAGRALFT